MPTPSSPTGPERVPTDARGRPTEALSRRDLVGRMFKASAALVGVASGAVAADAALGTEVASASGLRPTGKIARQRADNLAVARQGRLPGDKAAVPDAAPLAAPAEPVDAGPAIAQSEHATGPRMQQELKAALAKPAAERKWTMVIDLQKCIGCSACTVACIAENNLPPGVVYRPVLEEEIGEYPRVTRRFTPRPCMHCDEPPCVDVCPVGATFKREDGIVAMDYNKCIGCRYCVTACPYAARYFDFGEHYSDGTPERQPYEESPTLEYGKQWKRTSVEGVVRKCTFCIQRLDAGMLPACVTTCIGEATFFGDQNDPNSLVSELMASGRAVRLKEELGTKPKVHYLV